MSVRLKSLVATTILSAAVAAPAVARDQINIVGSSTVFPFSTTVAERFGKTTALFACAATPTSPTVTL